MLRIPSIYTKKKKKKTDWWTANLYCLLLSRLEIRRVDDHDVILAEHVHPAQHLQHQRYRYSSIRKKVQRAEGSTIKVRWRRKPHKKNREKKGYYYININTSYGRLLLIELYSDPMRSALSTGDMLHKIRRKSTDIHPKRCARIRPSEKRYKQRSSQSENLTNKMEKQRLRYYTIV